MKIGLIGINVGGPDVAAVMEALALKAEAVGMESLWTFDHVCRFVEYTSRYPGSADGKLPGTPETSYVDPLVSLTYVAARTRSIRLGTGITLLPQTNPLLLAKQAASLDVLSGGRFMLGVGAGWCAEEYEAMGTPFPRRGARMDDYLTGIKKVWTGDVVEHRSEFLNWSKFKSRPVPLQKPHIPIYIGGAADAVMRRVVAHGNGWLASGQGPDVLSGSIDKLNKLARDAGRDPNTIDISSIWIPGDAPLDEIKRFEDMGVSRLVIRHGLLGPDPLEGLDRLADTVLAKL
ncbi:MAG TPA: LLM class F420-dependent oxidoreductase [bacterium]|nr:LLM class F420-dependent oxidoreductase [bacterium]